MTIRYVGPGGNDGWAGTSWGTRKLTLNGVEGTVNAGDTVYVGPGTYREKLTVDVTGSLGNVITYIGDVTGINTDGVGGQVRITGSNNDISATRDRAIEITTTRDYRTFRGFRMDFVTTFIFYCVASDNIILEDCYFGGSLTGGADATYIMGGPDIIRRCVFDNVEIGLYFHASSDLQYDHLVENCIFYQCHGYGVYLSNQWGTTIKNCTFYYGEAKNIDNYSIASGNNSYMYNNLFFSSGVASADATNTVIDDYSYIVPCQTGGNLWSNVSKGSNSVYGSGGLMPRLLLDGFYLQQHMLDFASYSPLKDYGCANSPPSEDFYGMTRPTTDSKKTRGAIQYSALERETTIVPSGESESAKMSDAMAHQIFVPVTGNQMTFSVEVYREANYAGTNPQLIIKQPGQSDRTTTDVGAASQFNELSDTFTPASSPPYVVMEIRNDNTATSGDYATYWGKFEVK